MLPHYDANIASTEKLAEESSSEKCLKSAEIWQTYGHEFVVSVFWPTLYIIQMISQHSFIHNNAKYPVDRLQLDIYETVALC